MRYFRLAGLGNVSSVACAGDAGNRASLRPSRVKRAGFVFFATRDYRAKSRAFNPRDHGMTERQTGIGNPGVIDLFGIDEKTGDVLLVMNESRPWGGGDEQLHELQEKFNTYASFVLDGEMTETHPELKGRTTRIELRCQYIPSDDALT